MSIHGVIMEGLDVKNDHINVDPWKREKVIMAKGCGSRRPSGVLIL